MTRDDLRDALIKLAKRTGYSVMEIDYMGRMIAQVDIDPLPPNECGEPFEFTGRKVSVFDDPDDLNCINPEVPKPDAQIDLLVARREYASDVRNIAAIYRSGRGLSIAQNWRLFMNTWDWFRFWSVRHPNPQSRVKFAKALRELDAAARQITDNVNARLQEQGVHVLGAGAEEEEE